MNTLETASARGALLEMARVIHALILREIATRFGKQKLGYLWAVLEPVLLVSILVFIFSVRGRHSLPGIGPGQFFISGIVPFLMFRHGMARVMSSIVGNKSLLVFPQVQFLDLALARFLLEVVTSFVIFVVLLTGLHVTGVEEITVRSPLGVLAAFIMLGLFGLGLGMILGAIAPLFPSVEPISHAVLGRPLFFLSGVFFTAHMMPSKLREYLLYNPLLNSIELLRYSLFTPYKEQYYDIPYTLWFLGGLIFLGLLMLRALRERILSQ